MVTQEERLARITAWTKPSSPSEEIRQERAVRMVQDALSSTGHLDGAKYKVYAKGSYRNNTNVRADSDVDIAVELTECVYYESVDGAREIYRPTRYSGGWTPSTWRAAIGLALIEGLGSGVDTSGRVAIQIDEVPGSRPNTDVVPSFSFLKYTDEYYLESIRGACVFPSDGGQKIVNWPEQQLQNGIALNNDTNRRYKRLVRILKRAENELVKQDKIDPLPSYFMECLVYNGSPEAMKADSLDSAVPATYLSVFQRLRDAPERMVEPNEIKPLFGGGNKWSPKEGMILIAETLTLLGYID